MRKDTVQISVCCLLLLIPLSVFVAVAPTQETPAPDQEQKTASQLWGDYTDANQNAIAASTNYNTAARATTDVSEKLAANKKTLKDSTKPMLMGLFSTDALWYMSAPTVIIPIIGSVTPTLDLVNSWGGQSGGVEGCRRARRVRCPPKVCSTRR